MSAQSFVVDVTASETRAPVSGAFVSLLDADGRVLLSRLTNESGRAVLDASAPGNYRVRAELIGRETQLSKMIALGHDANEPVSMVLPLHALPLSEIRVETSARCRIRPAEALELRRVWEEARKAITVQAWAEGGGLYELAISTYERDLDATGRRVEREDRRGARRVTRVPFASLPPQDLATDGFVRRLEDGGHEYLAPDATVLLSDVFLDTHCFRLTRSDEHRGAIGLAFEPVGAADGADIRGTLWLNEATAALRSIEFGYTRAPYREAEGVAGGRIEFEALPNGAWMINRWSIRAPLLARDYGLARAGDSGIRVIGIRETGGEVVGVSTRDRRPVSRVARGSVRGVVWDSITAGPLPGARVELSGTAYAAETDGEGRFLLDELAAGVFTAIFGHPRLDSLGVTIAGVEVEVTAGRTTELTLATPSRATMLIAACRASAETETQRVQAVAEQTARDSAVLSGVVRTRNLREPVPGASIRVEWQSVLRLEPIVQARDRWLEVQADEEGRYTVCGLPVDEAVRVQAFFLNERSDIAEVAFADDADDSGHRVLDLEIDLPATLLASDAARDSAGTDAPGDQGVQGRVLDLDSGRPVRAAEIVLRSDSGRVLATGTTNERGFFRLRVPRSGSVLLSARALGYAGLEGETVDVPPERLAVVDVRLPGEAIALEPIIVTAEARSFHLEMQGFYRRRDDGFGLHVTPEVLERRQPVKTTDLFFSMPGVRVIEPAGGGRGRAILLSRWRDPRDSPCWPMVYVDRHLVSTGSLGGAGGEPLAVDEVVATDDILAIEVYRSPAEIPSEFSGPNAGCGVVVIWTRRGGAG